MIAEYFFPFLHVVLLRAATVKQVNKDMPLRVNAVFDQGRPLDLL
jgi:hypothetical protein